MKHVLAYALVLAPLIATPFAASPVQADVPEVVDQHLLPGYAAFAQSSADLASAAAQDCSPVAVRPAWNAAFDGWLGISHIRFGPVEDDGRSVSIAFWPDTRGAGPRALAGLIADEDDTIATPEGTARISAAARGIYGLEYLLYDDRFSSESDYSCALIQALTADLAAVAQEISTDWQTDYAEVLRTAGDEGNTIYLSTREAKQALFTSLVTGLEFTADQRFGRPMGSFDRPRPKRAEAWRSGRSLRNVALSLAGMRELAQTLSDGEAVDTLAAFDTALDRIAKLDDPIFAGVDTPLGRLKVEVVQQAVRAVHDTALAEIGPDLGVAPGFNSADGD